MRQTRLLPACALASLLCVSPPAAFAQAAQAAQTLAPAAAPQPAPALATPGPARAPEASALPAATPLPRPVPLPAAPSRSPVRTASAILSPALVLPAPDAAPLTPAAVSAEAARLRANLAREVPALLPRNAAAERALLALLRRTVAASDFAIDHPQLLVAVDRSTTVQQISIVLARPDGGAWEVLGTAHVSTGQAGRFDHYVTPTGVFPHTDLILDYRAEGTFNENHVRGLGLKGMRVWDFGWQWAHRGWGTDASPIQIRLEMHATDPSVLAQRIGHTASQGCVRIPDAMNRFLDRHGVLDAEYERAAVDEIRYRALLLPDRTPTPLAGSALVVVDSSGAP